MSAVAAFFKVTFPIFQVQIFEVNFIYFPILQVDFIDIPFLKNYIQWFSNFMGQISILSSKNCHFCKNFPPLKKALVGSDFLGHGRTSSQGDDTCVTWLQIALIFSTSNLPTSHRSLVSLTTCLMLAGCINYHWPV